MNNFFHFLTIIKKSSKHGGYEQHWCSCGEYYMEERNIRKHIKEENNE